jgi:hypothetical protein
MLLIGSLSSNYPLVLGPVPYSNPNVLTPSPPNLTSAHSSLREAQVGDDLVVTSNFANHDRNYDWAAYFITEIRDANDLTVQLTLNSGIVNSSSLVQVGAAWAPEVQGDYSLRVFAISDLNNPRILSPISSAEVTIASSQTITGYP